MVQKGKDIDDNGPGKGCEWPYCESGSKVGILVAEVKALTALQREHAIWQKEFWESRVDFGAIGEAVDMMKKMFVENDADHTDIFKRLRTVEADYVKETAITEVREKYVSKKEVYFIATVIGLIFGAIQMVVFMVQRTMAASGG